MEYEIKFRLKDKESVLNRLKKLKAEDLGEEKEIDIFMSLNAGSVRIRKLKDRGIVTMKRSVFTKERAKVKEELQTGIADPGALIEILKRLSFRETKRIEKIRHTFRIEENVYALLDRLPFIGNFLEIEADSSEKLKKTARILGFDLNTASTASYSDIFLYHCVKRAGANKDEGRTMMPTFECEENFNKGAR